MKINLPLLLIFLVSALSACCDDDDNDRLVENPDIGSTVLVAEGFLPDDDTFPAFIFTADENNVLTPIIEIIKPYPGYDRAQYSLSPNNYYLVYYLLDSENEGWILYLSSIEGGKGKKIRSTVGLSPPDIVWSPGGNYFAFATTDYDEGTKSIVRGDTRGKVREYSYDSSTNLLIETINWSGDGKRLYYTTWGRDIRPSRLWELDNAKKEPFLLMESSESFSTIRPSFTGDYIIFKEDDKPGECSPWSVFYRSSAITEVIEPGVCGGLYNYEPVWSPSEDVAVLKTIDARLIAFDPVSTSSVFVSDGVEDASVVEYLWSPDGKRLAFSNAGTVTGPYGTIDRMQWAVISSRERQGDNADRGVWRPDGTSLAYPYYYSGDPIVATITAIVTEDATFEEFDPQQIEFMRTLSWLDNDSMTFAGRKQLVDRWYRVNFSEGTTVEVGEDPDSYYLPQSELALSQYSLELEQSYYPACQLNTSCVSGQELMRAPIASNEVNWLLTEESQRVIVTKFNVIQ